ncbi:MAG: nitroreductase family protein [Candidatus Cloacimonadota bacterium]|nr:nitroreductase family protein [Candidatus Cloacimonadota bacterium]
MEFDEVIISRKSVRSFKNKEIPEEILNHMMEAARLSPSFQNRQCWRFIIVRNKKTIKDLALKSGLISKVNFFIKDAPVVVVACANPAKSGTINNQNYYLVDTAIAFQQMMLSAWNHGIGSCWLAAFNEEKVREILKIPQNIRVVALSPFGYSKGKKSLYEKAVKTFAQSKKRNELNKIISYEKWNL